MSTDKGYLKMYKTKMQKLHLCLSKKIIYKKVYYIFLKTIFISGLKKKHIVI